MEIHLLITLNCFLEGESHETYQELVLCGQTASQNVLRKSIEKMKNILESLKCMTIVG